jgi:glycosyltransferase involved in cell wall biosynthesis
MRFTIISSCILPWGGSEELWADAALRLRRDGHEVCIIKLVLDPAHPRIRQLQLVGCSVIGLSDRQPLLRRVANRLVPSRWQQHAAQAQLAQLRLQLMRLRPHLVVVAQGSNFDGVALADLCRQQGQPFVLVAQKAAEIFFPPQRALARQVYQAALHCYFVSDHNRQVTQYQLGLLLARTTVVANPFRVPSQAALPWPATVAPVRLACVARLEVLDKGQDVLLQVLASPKWRQRAVHVSFFGSGGDGPALEQMAELLGLADRVTWAGQVPDIAAVWASHHALVLPSRFEGLPLALAEAMLCGRPAIAAAAGGIAELLLDNETGFLAASSTVAAFDEALERAWARIGEWPEMGVRAATYARACLPTDPGAVFAQQLTTLAQPLALRLPHLPA